MLIGLCGGICSGKHAIADYLIEHQEFQLLELNNKNYPRITDNPEDDLRLQASELSNKRNSEFLFDSVESLLDFATKRWRERWVTTDIWDAATIERFLQRPFFLLVSVDAPVSLRWKRFTDRCRRRQLDPPPLERFVIWNDRHLYDKEIGRAYLTDRAQMRLFNSCSSLEELHAALEALNLADEQRLRPNWDQYFMQLASLAAQRSNCMKRRVGCVLVRERRVISTGYNGTPRHLTNCNEGGCPRCNRGEGGGVGLSTCLCLHAEENALLEAGRERIREGSILYCDTCPCLTCTVKIAQVGISEVVYSQGYNMDQESAAILKAAGVCLRQFSPPRNGLIYLQNSQNVASDLPLIISLSVLKYSTLSYGLRYRTAAMPTVHLLDYVAGNVRSLVNAINKVGFDVEWIKSPADIKNADRLMVPGVGHFGHCLSQLSEGGFLEPIRQHIELGKPFMGICVGLQALFEGSEEDSDTPGLGLIPQRMQKFNADTKSVPHIGWNSAMNTTSERQTFYGLNPNSKYYYVHSFAALYKAGVLENEGWSVATATYGDEEFIGAIARENVFATQFHPEKSGQAGLRTLRAFLNGDKYQPIGTEGLEAGKREDGLTRRIIACLDVRTNDAGDLVVTKGDQYDVREKVGVDAGGQVRNLGKPVDMAKRYYEQGADEVTFLNITSFRNCPLVDTPMLEILRRTSETVFVPLTIGGGIKDTIDPDGTHISALDVATMYFKSGADKVSIGSDAVIAAEEYYHRGEKLTGKTAIETISKAYGNQAVVVSVDPKRVYVTSPDDTEHHTIKTKYPNASGQTYCWYQCTIKGGRESRDIDVRQLVKAVEAMGAGEILLNCIDKDGSNSGFDLELINDVKAAIKIPVIASSGAGVPKHFEDVFRYTATDAALGAGMFHRGEFTVGQVKEHLRNEGFLVRNFESDE
ncbi:histidine biosynthesis bifunctional protein hisB [Aspergillus pseudoviridinutans]|uniref:Deoxycytidylate deaminase n=1 Tax=Aspergillus pseudoviridinutans TaxID=1517512 RepID=A0A9P3BHG6_9EURO|nr:histidine biosynthesis bifunctional protein hisB [Aspergillus pseudoviridinutans]GIJ88413.1 histidine biosynthesis bifunctional protein hisB [Aspergillus pseudoviridinutans]